MATAFLQWLRGRPCACEGRNPDCGGDMQAAHVPVPGEKGIGTKVADRHAIPLSSNCHRVQHDKGWLWFAATFLFRDPVKLSDAYWAAWPGRVKWEDRNG